MFSRRRPRIRRLTAWRMGVCALGAVWLLAISIDSNHIVAASAQERPPVAAAAPVSGHNTS